MGFSLAPTKIPCRDSELFHCFQFPLLGIFSCTIIRIARSGLACIAFNSRYLGFSLAPSHITTCSCSKSNFQFPLLGIFSCTKRCLSGHTRRRHNFQFPLLGIFSCTYECTGCDPNGVHLLSIPVTWDFLLHRPLTLLPVLKCKAFNSRYLGFSLAPLTTSQLTKTTSQSFNSRYLGFSLAPLRWSSLCPDPSGDSFNSRYLGFSLAPQNFCC